MNGAVLFAAPSATRAPAAAGKRLLIVAPQKFQDELQAFITFKKQFRPVEFVTLEKALKAGEGVDDPERLKRFIYRAWKDRGLGYVLLVGDR
ncbi:MAG TPA: C25 family cysteine peptidase, partial [Pirellulales bacterium]|nr:C25 family cysteine peptidase [Pirellulales bacterium]